jgi:hypothetical protein
MTRDTFKSAVLDSLRMNRSVVVVMVGYILAALALGYAVGIDVSCRFIANSIILDAFQPMGTRGPDCPFAALSASPGKSDQVTWHLLIGDLRIMQRGLIALPCILLFPQFSSAFTSVKSSIPLLHPYGLDPLFASWDSLIHGGHAWELIHPLVGYPLVTLAINFRTTSGSSSSGSPSHWSRS